MSSAIKARGTKIKIGDGGTPETFTTIAEVTDISGPTDDTEEIEVTNHDSPAGTKEVIMGDRDLGTLTFSGNFIPTNATHDWLTGMVAVHKAGTKHNFQLVYPDVGNTTRAFQAYIKTLTVKAASKAVLSFDGTLRITGDDTWTA